MFIFLQMAVRCFEKRTFGIKALSLIWNKSIESSGSLDELYGKFSSTSLLVPHLREGKRKGRSVY